MQVSLHNILHNKQMITTDKKQIQKWKIKLIYFKKERYKTQSQSWTQYCLPNYHKKKKVLPFKNLHLKGFL